MKLSNLSASLILAAFPLFMMSCGSPNDRNTVVNPKIEGRLIVLKNVEDITKNSTTPALYSKTVAVAAPINQTPSPELQASTTAQTGTPASDGTIIGDVQKLVNMVASADRKGYLERHLNAGGKIGFAIYQDHIRIFAKTTKEDVSKIASGPADLTITDIVNSKNQKIEKSAYVKQTLEDSNPSSADRYLEVAALEIEKSGVLESEKSDYNETKPLLTINTNLPIEISTHILLKQEIVLPCGSIKILSENPQANHCVPSQK